MGMQGTTKLLSVTMLMPGFQASGTIQIIGQLQTFVNDDQKAVFQLRDVTLYGLERGNPATSISLPELYVRKDQCHALILDREMPQEETGLMQRVEQIAGYTSHFVIQGGYHMGSDSLISDFMASSRAQFIGVTHANLFPLFEPQAAVIQEAPLLYIYRSAVKMHHLV
jgi:hypothetical protein